MHEIHEGDVKKSIQAGYYRVMFRDIDQSRLDALEQLYQQASKNYLTNDLVHSVRFDDREIEKKSFTVVANALLNLDEFLTKN